MAEGTAASGLLTRDAPEIDHQAVADVSLDSAVNVAPTAETASMTHPVPGVVIYPHGYSIRAALLLEAARAQQALERCGWAGTGVTSRTWRYCELRGGIHRWVMRGSVWLHGRRPSNRRRAINRGNTMWKTCLYNLAVEEREGHYAIDLQGVRFRDVDRFLQEILGLEEAEYKISYWRVAERYIVLFPLEALRLAEALDGRPQVGRARLSRKRYLVRDLAYPITIRARANAEALLTVYRIAHGATYAFKCEARLVAKRNTRTTFTEADIPKLDEVLLGLVADHGLHPLGKPARWEPRTFTTAVERGGFDRELQKVGQRAWRGGDLTEANVPVVEKCHTLGAVRLVTSRGDHGLLSSTSSIRRSSSLPPPPDPTPSNAQSDRNATLPYSEWECVEGTGFTPTLYQRTPSVPCTGNHPQPHLRRSTSQRLVDELRHLPGTLTEIVLDAQQEPGPLLHELGNAYPGLGVAALCLYDSSGASTWGSVQKAVRRHPWAEDAQDMVLVIDPSALCAVDDAVSLFDPDAIAAAELAGCGETEEIRSQAASALGRACGDSTYGPLVPDRWMWDITPCQTRAMAAWLWGALREVRDLCERTGNRTILITVDARPDHGRGTLLRSHYFRDSRVRSWIGDAARRWCHQRYFVEPGPHRLPYRVVAWKDEAEGLTGRVL